MKTDRLGEIISIFSLAAAAIDIADTDAKAEVTTETTTEAETEETTETEAEAITGGSIPHGEPVKAEPFPNTSLSRSICRRDSSGSMTGPCASREQIDILKLFMEESSLSPKMPASEISITDDPVTNRVAASLGCKDEKCIYENKRVQGFFSARGEEVDICKLFKPDGPRSSDEWLSNFNIHNVLDMYIETYPEFEYYKCVLMDFEKKAAGQYPDMKSTPITDLLSKGKTVIGSVPNVAKGSSGGTHWVSLLVDARNKKHVTIEYFNSTGDPPSAEFQAWMDKTQKAIEAYPPLKGARVSQLANRFTFQRANTECGVYALYFIRARLEGIPFENLTQQPIGDKRMMDFRHYIFSPTRGEEGEVECLKTGGASRSKSKETKQRRAYPKAEFYRIDGGWNLVPIDPF